MGCFCLPTTAAAAACAQDRLAQAGRCWHCRADAVTDARFAGRADPTAAMQPGSGASGRRQPRTAATTPYVAAGEAIAPASPLLRVLRVGRVPVRLASRSRDRGRGAISAGRRGTATAGARRSTAGGKAATARFARSHPAAPSASRGGDDPAPIQCGCGCRGDAGLTHVACRTEVAERQGERWHDGWHTCPTCGQEYTGDVAGPGAGGGIVRQRRTRQRWGRPWPAVRGGHPRRRALGRARASLPRLRTCWPTRSRCRSACAARSTRTRSPPPPPTWRARARGRAGSQRLAGGGVAGPGARGEHAGERQGAVTRPRSPPPPTSRGRAACRAGSPRPKRSRSLRSRRWR